MLKFSLYDFDRTIYSKDTGLEIITQLFQKHPKTILYIPKIVYTYICYICRVYNKKQLKEGFFSPINCLTHGEWNQFIQQFWQIEKKHLFPEVLKQIKTDRAEGYTVGIISASAEIFLLPIVQELKVDFTIGTTLTSTETHITSQIVGENCKHQEKVNRFYQYIKQHYPNQEYICKKMYSDSLNDLPLFEITEEQYTVEYDGSIRLGLPKPNNNI